MVVGWLVSVGKRGSGGRPYLGHLRTHVSRQCYFHLDNGATGAYNSYFTALGNSLVAYNLSNSILRIGWEFNLGTDFKWNSAANATLWAQFFQQIVTTLRAVKGSPPPLLTI